MEVSGQLHAPGFFVPEEGAFGTHWIGLKVGLDAWAKRITFYYYYRNYYDYYYDSVNGPRLLSSAVK
jgi:hypothetical protein